MGYSNIITAVKDKLSGITNIGVVYDYERFSAHWNEYLNQFKYTDADLGDTIKGWVITRRSTAESNITVASNSRVHTVIIRGFLALNDADETEKKFQELIETICDEFRDDIQVDGTAFLSEPIQLTVQEPREFGSVIVHYAELSKTIEEEIQWR